MRSVGRELWVCDEECNGNGSNDYNHSSLEDSDLQHLNQVLHFFFECFLRGNGIRVVWDERTCARGFLTAAPQPNTSPPSPPTPHPLTTKNQNNNPSFYKKI